MGCASLPTVPLWLAPRCWNSIEFRAEAAFRMLLPIDDLRLRCRWPTAMCPMGCTAHAECRFHTLRSSQIVFLSPSANHGGLGCTGQCQLGFQRENASVSSLPVDCFEVSLQSTCVTSDTGSTSGSTCVGDDHADTNSSNDSILGSIDMHSIAMAVQRVINFKFRA
jgi:hypothetical protein